MGDRFIIPQYLSYSDLGIYTLGYKMGGIINMFILQSFQLGFLPIAFKMFEDKDAKRFFSKVLTYFSFVLIIAALGLSMFAKELIILFSTSNSDYWAAFVVVPLISFSFVIKGWQYYFSLGLHYVKRTSYNAWIVMGCAALSLGLNFLLIPEFGIMGAAITITLANLVMAILYYFVSQRFYRINFELSRILKMTVTGAVLYGLSFFAGESQFWTGIIIKVLLFAAFPVILYYLKFFEQAELMHISQTGEKLKNRLFFKQNS
jgi:O-antigen/teichoic acid export membrane protein